MIKQHLENEITRCERFSEEIKMIRLIRCWMGYHNVRMKDMYNKVSENVKVSQSSFSKIMNESLESVSEEMVMNVLCLLLKDIININQMFSQMFSESVMKEYKEKIEKLNERINQFESLKQNLF